MIFVHFTGIEFKSPSWEPANHLDNDNDIYDNVSFGHIFSLSLSLTHTHTHTHTFAQHPWDSWCAFDVHILNLIMFIHTSRLSSSGIFISSPTNSFFFILYTRAINTDLDGMSHWTSCFQVQRFCLLWGFYHSERNSRPPIQFHFLCITLAIVISKTEIASAWLQLPVCSLSVSLVVHHTNRHRCFLWFIVLYYFG